MERSRDDRKRPREGGTWNISNDEGKEEAPSPSVARRQRDPPAARALSPTDQDESAASPERNARPALESWPAGGTAANPLFGAGGTALLSSNVAIPRELSRSTGAGIFPPQLQQQPQPPAEQVDLQLYQYFLAQAQAQQPLPQHPPFNLYQPPRQRHPSNTAHLLQALQHQHQPQDLLQHLQLQQQGLQPHLNSSLSPLTQTNSNPMLQYLLQSHPSHQLSSSLQEQMMHLQGLTAQPLSQHSRSHLTLQDRQPGAPAQQSRGTTSANGYHINSPSAAPPGGRSGTGATLSAGRNSSSTPMAVPLEKPRLAGRDDFPMSISDDETSLSSYQCLARKQIELFEAKVIDVERGAQGRNKPIVLGQVGVRCLHCKKLALKQRARASTYYPAKLNGLYQSAQNIINGHLCGEDCCEFPADVKKELLRLQIQKSQPGGGKKYWAEMATKQDIFEDEHGLRFRMLEPSPHSRSKDGKSSSLALAPTTAPSEESVDEKGNQKPSGKN